MKKHTLVLTVKAPVKMPADKVAELVSRLIAVGREEAVDSVDLGDCDPEAKLALKLDISCVYAWPDPRSKECKRCGTDLDKNGYCGDETCPHSDHLQDESWVEG